MGRRFGFDFSRVRVYADGEAGRSAEELNALAYTEGHRVVFAPGQFAPTTTHGLRLLSHELAHVIQQSGGSGRAGVRGQAQHAVQRQKAPDIDLARKLGTKLKAGKRDDVLADIEALPAGDLSGLELAVTEAFALDKDLAEDLRRVIRFVRHKPKVGAGGAFGPPKGKPEGGAVEKGATAKVGIGTVEVKTGVSVETAGAGSSAEAYTLSYTGDDADKMHWMQFVWRKVDPKFPAKTGIPSKPMEKKLTHSSRNYPLTTDKSKPGWLVDSGMDPGTTPGASGKAFYEESVPVNRSAKAVRMTDFPSTMEREIAPLFADASKAPTSVVSHFHADTYLIRNMDVVYRAQIDLEWEFKSATPSPVKATVTGGAADHIEAEQRATLVTTDPTVDFLAGAKPDPLGEFAPIKDLSPPGTLSEKDWAAAKSDEIRFADIVKVAHAEWINETSGVPSSTIHHVNDKKDAQPGLNLVDSLPGGEGETGYVDAAGHYVGRALPIDKTGPLPQIAIMLGPEAFKPGKAAALETLRHEEKHFTHAQLAVGWLLQWRDERAGKPFMDWLRAKHSATKISDVNFEVVKTWVDLSSLARTGTEVFAYFEGIETGLPFLPPKPEIGLMKGGGFPAAIDQLHSARVYFDSATSVELKKQALQGLRDFCCQDLDPAHRDGFVAWIKFLLNPYSIKASSKDEKAIQDFVAKDFKSSESFLKQVLKSVQKPCT